jgi:hypothetical protein
MSKTFKIYAVIFIIILIVMGMFEMNKKPVLDWRKNYNVEKKHPLDFIFLIRNQPVIQGKTGKSKSFALYLLSKKSV